MRTPPRGWCGHYSFSRRRGHRIAATGRVYACFATSIHRGVDIRATSSLLESFERDCSWDEGWKVLGFLFLSVAVDWIFLMEGKERGTG